jgi:hypothetical protein
MVDGRHHVEIFGHVEEMGRWQDTVDRVLPARQRLHPDDLQGRGVELRLVPGQELVGLEPVQDLVGHPLGADHLGLQS